MRFSTRRSLLVVTAFFVIFLFFGFISFDHKPRSRELFEAQEKYDYIDDEVMVIREALSAEIDVENNGIPESERIAVLIIACNRANALQKLVKKVMLFRRDPFKFPIIVSQDCDHESTANVAKSFGKAVEYVKHEHQKFLHVNRFRRKYHSVAVHYKKALDFVFLTKKYSTVIVLEDDLEISIDIFEYFSATLQILRRDPTLWCVSAWNDNGLPKLINESNVSLLYRTDFFGGLGWMVEKSFWNEIGPIWPDGYWDDWMRLSTTRKNRQCIRPEVGRTGMTRFGKNGVSKGLFFNDYLSKIAVNKEFVEFRKLDLNYLLEDNYAGKFLNMVYNKTREFASWEEFQDYSKKHQNEEFQARIRYTDYESTVERYKLGLMQDTKDGIPRTAYRGIVTFMYNNRRVFLVP